MKKKLNSKLYNMTHYKENLRVKPDLSIVKLKSETRPYCCKNQRSETRPY